MQERFHAPVQTGPVAHPASCTMGNGSFPGVKRPDRGVDYPIPSSAEVKERVELIVVYVFLLFVHVFLTLSMYSYCSSMYSYCCLCILIVVYVFLDAATLTEVVPCFFLGCIANARV